MPTLQDVAALAQVSIATVSRVLRQDRSFAIPNATRQKVIDAAHTVGYQIRKSSQRTTGLKGEVKIVTVKNYVSEQDSPYFVSIISGIHEECEQMGLGQILTAHWSENNFESFGFSNQDNVIAVNCPLEVAEWFQKRGINVVFANTNPSPSDIISVCVDFIAGTRMALDHLMKLGHEKIGIFCGARGVLDPRLDEFRMYMSARDLLDEKYIWLSKDWTIDEGYQLGKMFAQTHERPTALFIASDRLAVGAMRAMSEYGISVPNDVAIVSFDDLDLAAYVTPRLTSIHVPSKAIGRLAIRLAMEQFGKGIIPVKVQVPLHLEIRESCGACLNHGDVRGNIDGDGGVDYDFG